MSSISSSGSENNLLSHFCLGILKVFVFVSTFTCGSAGVLDG